MIHQKRLFHPLLLAALMCGTATISAFAQGPEGPGPDGHHGGHHGPPVNPLFDALDTNHDGVLSAEEMANASTSLKALLKNGSTQLTRDDLRPTPPAAQPPAKEDAAPERAEAARPHPPAIREHQPPRLSEDGLRQGDSEQPAPSHTDAMDHRGPRRDEGEAMDHRGPRHDEGERHHGPPASPIFDALDTNHDGTLSDEEIDNAPNALKSLLKRGTTELRREDLRPHGPRDRRER